MILLIRWRAIKCHYLLDNWPINHILHYWRLLCSIIKAVLIRSHKLYCQSLAMLLLISCPLLCKQMKVIITHITLFTQRDSTSWRDLIDPIKLQRQLLNCPWETNAACQHRLIYSSEISAITSNYSFISARPTPQDHYNTFWLSVLVSSYQPHLNTIWDTEMITS